MQKINQKNTWELNLIDHLTEVIKVDEEDDTETNFQKVLVVLFVGNVVENAGLFFSWLLQKNSWNISWMLRLILLDNDWTLDFIWKKFTWNFLDWENDDLSEGGEQDAPLNLVRNYVLQWDIVVLSFIGIDVGTIIGLISFFISKSNLILYICCMIY